MHNLIIQMLKQKARRQREEIKDFLGNELDLANLTPWFENESTVCIKGFLLPGPNLGKCVKGNNNW